MMDLRELYQETILDHSRHPRNKRQPDETTHRAFGHNPLCGDQIAVHLKIKDDHIEDIGFLGSGCAISIASASIMTDTIKGKSLKEANELAEKFYQMVVNGDSPQEIGKLIAFSGVREFPIRVKCATLAWHALQAAIEGKTQQVSTEEEE
jgi:nitrogen fixation NifU-like protein